MDTLQNTKTISEVYSILSTLNIPKNFKCVDSTDFLSVLKESYATSFPLSNAIYRGNVKVIEFLLERDILNNLDDDEPEKFFLKAVKKKDEKVVNLLLKYPYFNRLK